MEFAEISSEKDKKLTENRLKNRSLFCPCLQAVTPLPDTPPSILQHRTIQLDFYPPPFWALLLPRVPQMLISLSGVNMECLPPATQAPDIYHCVSGAWLALDSHLDHVVPKALLFLLCHLKKRAHGSRGAHRSSPPDNLWRKNTLRALQPEMLLVSYYLRDLTSPKTGNCTSMKLMLSSLSQVCSFLLNTSLDFLLQAIPGEATNIMT